MKGIVLAGGLGSRLYPATLAVTKQLLPVYDKPMIYYPLSILMLANIKEILVITTEKDINLYRKLLGDGSKWGITLEYKIQPKPNGIAEAFILGENFIGSDDVCLVLGDNIFYGADLPKRLKKVSELKDCEATIFAYHVSSPQRYGVVEFDENLNVLSIEEKPEKPKSNHVVTGLYFYKNNVVNLVKSILPSARGELEITDLNKLYADKKTLKVELLGRGTTWLDTGTHDSLLEASVFVATLEKRQGLKISCLEEIAFHKGYIDREQLESLARPYLKNKYGQYLMKLIGKKDQ